MSLNNNEIENIIEYVKQNNSETTWIEVKENKIEVDKLGETISAIANSCLLDDKDYGYIIIGIKDKTWEILGTSNRLSEYHLKGGQEVKLYISTMLLPRINFEFIDDYIIDNKKISVIKIPSATHTPISYKNEIYLRIGSNNKLAKEYPEKLRILWNKTSGFNYEETIVREKLTIEEVLNFLDYRTYFKMKGWDENKTSQQIIDEMELDGFIVKEENYKFYKVKALGALLLAHNLKDFNLERKAVRIVIYNGITKSSIREQLEGKKGYAIGFENIIKVLKKYLPQEQRSINGRMEVFEFYPQAIIRELIANAIIHQDLSMTGSEIKIEVYDNRVEITNPGKSVIDLWRFYDCNKSRNEKLAYYMRQLKLCEELGSGIDRIVEISELNNLFTPKFIITNEYVNAKLFREKKFEQMVEEDKINILYYHCCFRYSIEDYMTNSFLRNRFLLDNSKPSTDRISNLIKKAKNMKLIKVGPNKSYIPFWAE